MKTFFTKNKKNRMRISRNWLVGLLTLACVGMAQSAWTQTRYFYAGDNITPSWCNGNCDKRVELTSVLPCGNPSITFHNIGTGTRAFKINIGNWGQEWNYDHYSTARSNMNGRGTVTNGNKDFILNLSQASDVTVTLDVANNQVFVILTAPVTSTPSFPYTIAGNGTQHSSTFASNGWNHGYHAGDAFRSVANINTTSYSPFAGVLTGSPLIKTYYLPAGNNYQFKVVPGWLGYDNNYYAAGSTLNGATVTKGSGSDDNNIIINTNGLGNKYVIVTYEKPTASTDRTTVDVCSDCTTAAQYTLGGSNAYDGSPKPVSITPASNAGAVAQVYYNGSTTVPSAQGTYTITADVKTGTYYCKAYGLNLGTYTITAPVSCTNPTLLATTASSTPTCVGATVGGNISNNGGLNINDYGIEWSKTSGFTAGTGTKVSAGTDNKSGAYTQIVTGLDANTTYYYRAYATNTGGCTGYGTTQESFTTTSVAVSTSAATNVVQCTSPAATLNGSISSNGGSNIDDYGFFWSTTNGFADGAGTKIQAGTNNHSGAYTAALPSLSAGTYYVKAYAKNTAGCIAYGSQVTVVTACTFKEGDVLWLDISNATGWKTADNDAATTMYVNFSDATGNTTTLTDARAMTPVVKNSSSVPVLYIYVVTALDEAKDFTILRFKRGNGTDMWNASGNLTATEYRAGTYNGHILTNANHPISGSNKILYNFTGAGSGAKTITITPTLTMSPPNAQFTNANVQFTAGSHTVAVGVTNYGTLVNPRYEFRYLPESSFAPVAQNSNTITQTGGWPNTSNGDASVKMCFPYNSTGTLSTTLSSPHNYSGTATTPYAIIDPCTAPDPFTIENSGREVYSQGVTADAIVLTAPVNGSNITYQWYVRDTYGTSGGTAVVGEIYDNLIPPVTSSDVGAKYYYLVATSDGYCPTTSTNAIRIITMGDCGYTGASSSCSPSTFPHCTYATWSEQAPGGYVWTSENHGSAGTCSNMGIGSGANGTSTTGWLKYTVTPPCSGTYKAKLYYDNNNVATFSETSLRASNSDSYANSLIKFDLPKKGWGTFTLSALGDGSITTNSSGNLVFYLFPGYDTKIWRIDFEFQASSACQLPTVNAGIDKCVNTNTPVELGATQAGTGLVGLWKVTDQPASSNYIIENDTLHNTNFKANKTGKYTLEWKVMDLNGNCTACDEMIVNVTNSDPITITVRNYNDVEHGGDWTKTYAYFFNPCNPGNGSDPSKFHKMTPECRMINGLPETFYTITFDDTKFTNFNPMTVVFTAQQSFPNDVGGFHAYQTEDVFNVTGTKYYEIGTNTNPLYAHGSRDVMFNPEPYTYTPWTPKDITVMVKQDQSLSSDPYYVYADHCDIPLGFYAMSTPQSPCSKNGTPEVWYKRTFQDIKNPITLFITDQTDETAEATITESTCFEIEDVGGTLTLIPVDCDANPCTKTDIYEISSTEFKIYPNPTNDIIYISGVSGVNNIIITDLTGKTVINSKLSIDNSINISKLPAGIYLLRVNEKIAKIVKK